MIRKLILVMVHTVDVLGAPVTCLSALWLRTVRRAFKHLPLSRRILNGVGLLPIRHHYYEPMIKATDLRQSLRLERNISGLDLNVRGQLELLERFDYGSELSALPTGPQPPGIFFYHNGNFESGDAEFLYNVVRHFKPARITEIGSGHSTLMARHAIRRNEEENRGYTCEHICIEPYEQPWLEATGVKVIRQKVESLDLDFFHTLERNDVLFIDSSHIIRSQGDVLFEYLELLGTLKSGVLVHAHDVFTPRDYLDHTVLDDSLLWNEQYLLEAFLSFNNEFTVIGALNYLWHNQHHSLSNVCPVLAQEPDREPGSFWFIRN